MDATPNWNNHAASKSFKPCTAQTENGTFGEAYEGSDFTLDFDAILAIIAAELLTRKPNYDESNILGVSCKRRLKSAAV